MDFWDATKVMFRRWYIALPLLLIGAAMTVYTSVAVKPDYVLTSYVQLIPSINVPDKSQEPNVSRNPWNTLGLDALSQAANYAVLDQTFLDKLSSDGYSVNFSIVVDTPPAGATIEVVGNTKQQAVETTNMVIKKYGQTVQQLQSQYGVKTPDMITMQRLDQGQNLKRPGGKVKRAILAVGGAALLFATGSTIAVDALLRRRRRNKVGATDTAEPSIEKASISVNGVRKSPTVDMEGETKRISTGEYRSSRAEVQATGAAPDRTAGEPAPEMEALSDATIVLPLTRDWPAGDKGSHRR